MKNYFQQLCSETHSSCSKFCLEKIFVYIKYAIKVYGLVHLLPMILFKRKELFSKPLESIKNFLIKVLKSIAFFVTYCTGVRGSLCLCNWINNGGHNILTILSILVLSNFSVLFEDSSRVLDYTLFTLPRSVEGLWNLFEKLGYVKSFKFGGDLIFAMSTAVAMLLYKKYPEDIPKSYGRLINYIYGKNI